MPEPDQKADMRRRTRELKPEPPDIPANPAVLTNLAFIDMAVEELNPGCIRGLGQVPELRTLRT
jgi:hypothetical protein